ncbi:hypothetical protein [Streptomyces microflavus]|uniref:hypothetical protein n=1 Tax=Streptomyces microflavus TaxID=1919 RepID=UPI00368FC786
MNDAVEEPPPPSPSEPAESTDAPDLPDPETGSHEPENRPGTEVQHEPENRPGTEVAHEPENRPGTDVATEPEVVDLEGTQASAEEVSTSSAGAGPQDRDAPDLPDPVDGPAQPDPAQVNDVQKAQADLDAANAAAQETEESPDDIPNQNDLESNDVTSAGTAPPLEEDSGANEQSGTRFASVDGLDTSPGNGNSTDQEDQASDRIQTDGASETGEDEPPGPPLTGDGEEDSGVTGDLTDSDEAAATQDTRPAADSADPGTQPREADEAPFPQVGSLAEDEDSPSPQDSAADGDADEDSKPTKEESLQKELVPEHRIEPGLAMEISENGDTSSPVVEEEPAPASSEPAETPGAPDLPEPQTVGDEPENHPGTEVATEPEATDLEGARFSTEEVAPSSAGNIRQDREAPDLPDNEPRPSISGEQSGGPYAYNSSSDARELGETAAPHSSAPPTESIPPDSSQSGGAQSILNNEESAASDIHEPEAAADVSPDVEPQRIVNDQSNAATEKGEANRIEQKETSTPTDQPPPAGWRSEIGPLRPPARELLKGEDVLMDASHGLQSRKDEVFDNVETGEHGDEDSKYLWTIDERGVNAALERTPFDTPRNNIVHSNISPEASIGGEAWFGTDGSVTINAGSGRFGDGAGITEAQWNAASQAWQELGYQVRQIPYGRR